MKKILSIILCLSMLMSSAVFAAPVRFAPIDVESAVEIDHTFAGTENEEAEAELSALPALAPVATYPANGASDVTVGDPAYKVTFSKAINPEDVTIENLGVAEGTVAGIYLDEGTNTVYLFPDSKKHDAVGATVSFPTIQSNISTADGANCLYFPAVSYDLNGSHGNDGENMVPYGNMEYGWVPLYGNDPATMYTEADGNHAVKIGGGSNSYKYFYVPVHFEPNTEYTYSYKIKTLKNDSKASSTIRYEPSTHSDGKTHFGKSGNVNTTTWTTITATHTTGEVTSTKGDSLANYIEPLSGKGVEFLVDDIVITKKVKINFAAGRNTVLNGTAPATLSGYNGETVTLPTTDAFATTDARWAIFGWTDGENTYNGGQEYTINGAKTLTPNVIALEDTVKVSFTSNMNGITLPETVEIFAGDSIDLTTSEFQPSVSGYWFDGWTVKGSDEYITSVTPDADVELEAKFSFMDYWDFTKKAHYDAFDVGDSNKTKKEYNSENGFVVIPLETDTQLTITSNTPVINADDYATAEITFVASDLLTEKTQPQLFFAAPGKWEKDSSDSVFGKFDRYEGENDKFIVYTFDMASNVKWTGDIGRLRLDPYDNMVTWTVKSIVFIKNKAVENVEITDIDTPAVRMTPDKTVTAASNANYTVTSVTWTPAATIFAPETKYTVNVTVAPARGYRFDAEATAATINGEAATVTVNIDKTATVSYEFDATESLIPVTVTADKSVTAITEDGGTIELSATVETVDSEDVIDTYDVTWSVDNEAIAYVEGNVLHAFNNGKVTVTATSVYDTSKSDSFEVEISGQTLFPVTFHAGTESTGVTNLPANIDFKGTLDLTQFSAPKRSGYAFMGWKTATYAEETITSIEVDKAVTIYASWAETAIAWEFNTDGNYEGIPQLGQVSEIGVKDGCYYFTANGGDPNATKSGLNIDANKFKTVEIRLSATMADSFQLFFVTTNAGLAEKRSLRVNYTAGEEFQTLVFNMGSNAEWTGTITGLRIDPTGKAGNSIKIDYIRIANNIEEYIDIGEIDTPVAMAEADTTAKALAASKFEVKSFEWEQELIDGKYFYGDTAYTANVVVAAKAGVKIADNAVATVNGNAAGITKNPDGTYTVKYTFAKTAKLADVNVVIDETKNAISTPDGSITLSAQVVDVATGEPVADQNIEWSVDNTDACILEGNKLTAYDNAEVIVTASSTYDRTKKATYKVTISNQIPPKTLTFHKGTNAAVSGMPASVVGKKPVDLTQYAVPTREGYIFTGWALNAGDDDTVTSVELSNDVNVYATWVGGQSWDFNTDGDYEGFGHRTDASTDDMVKDGCYSFKSILGDPNMWRSVNINADVYKVVEFRISVDKATSCEVYFATPTNGGLNGTDRATATVPLCADGEFTVVRVDMSTVPNWKGTVTQLRLDPVTSADINVKIDYIRVVNYVEEYINIGGIDTPVAMAEADTSAEAIAASKIEVKSVAWEEELLDGKYFYGDTAYTANVVVAAKPGTVIADNVSAIVNGNAAGITKNPDGTYTVKYTFTKTAKLTDIKVVVDETNNAISTRDGSIELSAQIIDVATGEPFADQNIEWSVDNKHACILEGNKLTAFDNAEVTVTATSTYDRTKSDSYVIKITNQITPYYLTLHKCTNDNLQYMPESFMGKGTIDLTQEKYIPQRSGYKFAGWALDKEGKNIVSSVELSKNVTVYAIWTAMFGYEFNIDGNFEGFDGMSTSKDKQIKDGCFVFTAAPGEKDPTKTDPNVTLRNLNFSASVYKTIEVRMSATIADGFKIYFEGTNAKLSESNALKVPYSASADGEFSTLLFDMSTMANWTGTINNLRFDPTDALGSTVKIDYIRVIGSACEFIDVTGVTTPAGRAVAYLTADSVYNDKFSVENVEWSPKLLYDRYFDENTAYTVNVTVMPRNGNAFSSAPAAWINGEEATSVKVNSDGTAVVSYKFPETGAIDNKETIDLTLISTDNDGEKETVKKAFTGDNYDLDRRIVSTCPSGMRWIGWAETDGDVSTVADSFVVEPGVNRKFYAQYEEITEYDFSNKYRSDFWDADSSTAPVIKDGALVVQGSKAANITADCFFRGLNLNTLDYGTVEVIFDAELCSEDFVKNATPALYSWNEEQDSLGFVLSSNIENVTDDGRPAYKYTFHPVNDDLWTGKMGIFCVVIGGPVDIKAAIRSIKFIPTKDVEVTLTGPEVISRPGRVTEYSAKIKVLDGTSIPRTDIAVEIVSMLDENGVAVAPADFSKYAYVEKGTTKLYPVRDCTLTIRGTSNYNKRAYDEISVVIKNQGTQYLVSYDLNASGVTGSAPASELAKGSFTPSVCTATRNGYFFSGWSTDPDDADAVSESFNITENTTLYAIWGKGVGYEFNTEGNFEGFPQLGQVSEIGVKDGCYYFTANGGDPNATKSGLNIDANKFKTVEIRLSATMADSFQLFFMTATAGVAEKRSLRVNYTAGEEFQTLVFNMGSNPEWTGTITGLRIDPTGKAGNSIKIDYIRVINDARSVKFKANGGSFTTSDGAVKEVTETINVGNFTVPYTPVNPGNKFAGWCRNANGTGKVYTGNTVKISDDVTFYAIWAPTADITDESSVTVTNGSGTVYNNGSALVYEGDGITVDEVVYHVAKAATVDKATDTTLLMKLSYNYKSMTDNSIKLIYDDANGQPQETTIASGLVKSMDSGYVLVKLTDLAITPAITGNITNVSVVMPEGVADTIAVEEITITDYDTAYSIYYDYMTYEAPEVEVSAGEANDNANPKTYAPSTQPSVIPGTIGGGTAAGSTVGTNNNSAAAGTGSGTSMIVPAGSTAGTSEGTTNTPVIGNQTIANNFKFKNEYKANTFTDVKSDDWFYGDVEKSYKLGLMNGKGGTTFDPNGAVTIAEAVTVASRIYAICVGKTIPAAKTGEAWYTPNVNYAIEAKIIKNGQFADYTAKATRKQVAEIFANCAPSGWLNVINMFTSIPDVDSKDASFNAILSLYNAGILTGVDTSYKFNPAAEIKRSEMSAIINRVAIPESRIRVVTEVEKNEAPFISGANGDEATLAGFYTGENSKISSVADPTDSSNEVYQIKIEKQGKVWSYLWHKMKLKAGETYKIEADIYLVSDFNGNPLTDHNYGLAFRYEGKDHGFGGGKIDSGKWVHVSKEYTVPASYQAQVGADAFGIYMDPSNDNGVTYLVDNLSVLPASGSVEIGGSSTSSSTGSSAGTTSANAATSVQFKSADDFNVFNIDGLKVNGSFKGTSTTNDANVVYKKNVNLNASEIKQIKIVAKIPKGKGAEVFFTTDSDKALSGSKRYGFTSTSDDFATYTINTSSNENWKGTIVQFRFDPVIGEGLDFEWKSIEFVK